VHKKIEAQELSLSIIVKLATSFGSAWRIAAVAVTVEPQQKPAAW
jgi:hypothetical protein